MAPKTDAKMQDAVAVQQDGRFTLQERTEILLQSISLRKISIVALKLIHIIALAAGLILLGWGLYHADQAGFLADTLGMMIGAVLVWSAIYITFLRLK